MTREEIIKEWRSGLTAMQVAKEYMTEYNRQAKRRNEPKITKDEALYYVERVIFEFETRDWKKG